MLNDEEKTTFGVLRHWYMPTVFSQMALSGTIPNSQVQEHYKEAFMDKVEVLRKIYVPVNEDNLHWYLVIFDMNQCQVILLDFNPDPKQVKYSTLSNWYIISVFKHLWHQFYIFVYTIFTIYKNTNSMPKVSEFPILEALGIGRQRNDFVTYYWFYHLKVDDTTRMRIAIDFIMKSYNLKKNTPLSRLLRRTTKNLRKRTRI
ncbi:hypothetical protein Ahy_A02g008067 [Arachis hypogaea]|uniref:Ubiquitin-like protease family profile domain-containing protein n=1 Tax=Arachis hypogaea TaxID=3818 RepID=A0A445EDQ3_ARAHY|nr:hypothetical protein Ahy_A02g008067 [Arachis hypogaea]